MIFILITSFFTGDVEWRFPSSDIHLRILTMLALTMLYTDEQEKGEHEDEKWVKNRNNKNFCVYSNALKRHAVLCMS